MTPRAAQAAGDPGAAACAGEEELRRALTGAEEEAARAREGTERNVAAFAEEIGAAPRASLRGSGQSGAAAADT